MDELFGLSMNTIMVVLLVLLAISLASIAYVALRNRIVFQMGVRNVPRRVAQTVLIVIGLMLSTLIISAAFGTGDTVDYSITKQAYTVLGHLDQTIQPGSLEDDASTLTDTGLDIPADQYQRFQEALRNSNNPRIDGSTGVLLEEVPVINPQSRLSEPAVTLAGVDASSLQGFPDFISAETGEELDLASLSATELYMNQSAADELDVNPGDRVQIWVENEPHEFTVVDVVEDRILTGAAREEAFEGMVTKLDTLHGLIGHDRISFIAISNEGGVRDGPDHTEEVEADLRQLIRDNNLRLGIGDSKADGIRTAEEIGNFMTTFFLLMGLFSIGAGVLLIIMIFVMLAAERKSEMGIARAVGMKRGHLVQMFMSEGMAYNIFSAMVGAILGILVAIGLAYLMTALFTQAFNLTIEPHVTPRTLVISYSLGVVLTFLTVTFSSWRVSQLNIVAAIRGTEEDKRPEARRQIRWLWVLLSIPAMVVPPLGLWLLLRVGLGISWAWIIAIGGLVLGAFLFLTGLNSDTAFPFSLGFSLITAGAARALALFKLPPRPVYTTAGLLLLLFWGLVAGGRLEFLFGPLEGDIEMFFLSGVAMVTASTFVLIYNSDLILHVVSRLGGAFGTILPALKTAVAYPLTNRFRTGMTLAMISLVVFALTMMSTMNLNFDKLFLNDSARGGWDIVVQENANNPIPDLAATLREAGSSAPDNFRVQGRIEAGGGIAATEVRQDRQVPFEDFPIVGMDEGFVTGGQIPLDHRARGFETEEAVWQAFLTRDDVAVIDGFSLSGGGFGDESEFDFSVSGIEENEDFFDPITLELHDPVSERTKEVQLIGVINLGASGNFGGLHIPDRTFREVFGEPELSWHYIGLNDPDESKAVAKEIESTLLSAGVQADSLKERADEEAAFFRNFFYLMQAFMGLGLFVGIAAVGVIAFRTVVERRQQIGMLRAIGYKRGMVALSFLMESSFITLLAIFSGIALAIWLSYFLVTSDDFPEGATYHVPWLQIVILALFTYGASLLMTWIPARQAANIPVAEALRYE